MRSRILFTLGMFAAASLTGCGMQPDKPHKNTGAGKGGAALIRGAEGSGEGLVGQVVKKAKDIDYNGDLKNISLFYIQFEAGRLKPPQNMNEFTTYFKRDAPQLVEKLEDGVYVVLWNTRPGPNNIIAYQNKYVVKGQHQVVRGDGSIHTMLAPDLKVALQQQQ